MLNQCMHSCIVADQSSALAHHLRLTGKSVLCFSLEIPSNHLTIETMCKILETFHVCADCGAQSFSSEIFLPCSDVQNSGDESDCVEGLEYVATDRVVEGPCMSCPPSVAPEKEKT
ncbi:hypothetical protein MRB53_036862 [Persea americana]|nr:hypothetical protein MRB53_036862 [Persea americana]